MSEQELARASPEWRNAVHHVEVKQAQSQEVHPIFQRAAERTLDVEVLGETITVKHPGMHTLKKALGSANKFQGLENVSSGQQSQEELEATMERLADEFCQVASDMALDSRLSYEAFRNDDHGMELAALLVMNTIQKITEQQEVVSSFRQDKGRSRVRATAVSSEKDSE